MSDKYPLSSKYRKREIDEADDLYDKYPIPVVSKKTSIPTDTLREWSMKGYIDSKTNHKASANRKYTDEEISRAGELWDRISLTEVGEVMGIPHATLKSWSKKGWIDTSTDHRSQGRRKRTLRRARRAARLVHEEDCTYRKAAEKIGVSHRTIEKYLSVYRQQEWG